MTTKQLRHCSAHVNINSNGFCNSYELVSYSTPVALLGMIDGTIVDDARLVSAQGIADLRVLQA